MNTRAVPQLQARSIGIDPRIVQQDGKSYVIDRAVVKAAFSPCLVDKLKGDPEVAVDRNQPELQSRMDAVRETYVAIRLAGHSGVERVYIGREKNVFLAESGISTKTSHCDAIAVSGRNQIVGLGEGKGTTLTRALSQLYATATQTAPRNIRSLVIAAAPPLYLVPPNAARTVSEAIGKWRPGPQEGRPVYRQAVMTANTLRLNPSYHYLISDNEGAASRYSGLGLAYGILSRADDRFLRTHRQFIVSDGEGRLDSFWNPSGPFKLTLPGTDAAGIQVDFVVADLSYRRGTSSAVSEESEFDEEKNGL